MSATAESEREFLTVREAAAVLRVSPQKVYELVHARALPVFDFGGCKRIARADLDAYVQQSRRAPR